MLASQTASSANGSDRSPSRVVSVSMTGVNNTAVVSRLIAIVVVVPSAAISRNSRTVDPPAARAHQTAAASNTPARSANSANTVIAARNPSTGPPRVSAISRAAGPGSQPIATTSTPATPATAHIPVSMPVPRDTPQRCIQPRGLRVGVSLFRHLLACCFSCPQSDSNRHWTDFKSAASANWAMGARRRI